MHEFSVVQSLLDLIEKNAKEHNAKSVDKVVVKIGRLSGIEPHLLELAFDTFKEKTICENAKLEMIIQEIIAICEDCKKEFVIKENEFICPYCKSFNINILDGEDMYLLSLEMQI
ncbi:hydrogenase maturation nickel metallochaperone HypA [Venenivibrio stagnispumantis]|uniref:Hydrogenase maturation factor HypA n=1 Tax=Venenivibrio stagnispumantis TaxID=407998 RepID=A0AA45WMS1_9AQUI|nr:hydrogenase/urease nickel incorporation protein HypA [Venenivibrio stagnispumantis]MCW4573085.1 hydrogenase/urease nickel incorporation protein HypA [Venenivibrio stagnispumantis]SMP15242.1 Hydrogenase-3 nickel incorporation protein HypA [Venenivibrio stagnispumantis]